MKEHFHQIWVTEGIIEVIRTLGGLGVRILYTPNPEEPDDADGFIAELGGTISSCSKFRRNSEKWSVTRCPMEPKRS